MRAPFIGFIKSFSAQKAVRLGDFYRDQGRWSAAANAYRQAVWIDPNLSGIWVQYGHAMKEQGDLEAAEKAYREAQKRGLDDSDIHLQLGHLLKLQRRTTAAIAAYVDAVRRDRTNASALLELQRMGVARDDLRTIMKWDRHAHGDTASNTVHPARSLAVDISDLAHYVSQFRRPSGIQRVQLGVGRGLLDDPPKGIGLNFVAFSPGLQGWVEIDREIFSRIAHGMSQARGADDSGWREVTGSLTAQLVAGDEFSFPQGAVLLNLGSSWALPNYFLALRRVRASNEVTFVHFVHDCIPVIAPQHFVPELQRDFREWIMRILTHCDGLVANSNSTANDIQRVAQVLGEVPPAITVAPLDAVPATGADRFRNSHPANLPFLADVGLEDGNYVLFVGTIEPRKNHLLAFDAWERLIKERGADGTPPLVCVGGSGWKNAAIVARLQESENLRSKVTLLQGVADVELDQLYRGCRFSLYPSRYEGWGLPVTESLAKGKVPLVARVSSLPEAGGDFAEYFELDDGDELFAKLNRLIDDDAYLADKEAAIATGFRPRSWAEITQQIVTCALTTPLKSLAGMALQRMPYGTFVRFAREPSGLAATGIAAGEGFRVGQGWGDLDETCAWFAGNGAAIVTFRTPREAIADPGGCRIAALVRASAEPALNGAFGNEAGISSIGLSVQLGSRSFGPYVIEAGRDRWLEIEIEPEMLRAGELEVGFVAASLEGDRCRSGAAGLVGMYLHGANDRRSAEKFYRGVALDAVRYSGLPQRLIHEELQLADVNSRTAIPFHEIESESPQG